MPRLITYGSAYLGADGGLIVSANNNAFYRVNVTNGSHTVLTAANGDANTNTDGTTCIAVPLVDVVKQAGAPVAVLNGHTFDVPYTLTVGNTGAVPTPNVQISDNLRNAFAAGTPTLGISAGRCSLQSGAGDGFDLSITCPSETWAKIILRELSAAKAMAGPGFQVEGDRTLLRRLGRLFPPPSE